MKIVISRKGFDSGYGRVASPILPDGRMISLPIPAARSAKRFGDIYFAGQPLSDITRQLTRDAVRANHLVHLDPDLSHPSLPRLDGWRPAFGQEKAAQRHLENNGIGPGDIFLFFGWFRQTEWHGGALRYLRGAPDLHVLFGYLQIDEVLPVGAALGEYRASHPWLADHPHLNWHGADGNTIYLGRDRLSIPGYDTDIAGAGAFSHFRPELGLTAEGRTRSVWKLPMWFSPSAGTTMTYHSDPLRWSEEADHVHLNVVAKGQEFVVDGGDKAQSAAWAKHLICGC